MHDVINPATELVVASVPSASLEETDAAIARAHAALPAWRDVAPADRAAMLRRFSDIVREHSEELAQLEVANAGHTISNARWEANNVANVLGYYAGAPERMFGRQIPVAGRHRHHVQGAGRRRRDHRAVELPHADRRLGLRTRAGGGLHRRPEARRGHAADGDPARRARARGGHPRGRLHRRPRQGIGRRAAVRRPSRRPQGRLHREHGGRPADHGRLRAAREGRHPGARRQERQRDLRRRRPREGGRHGAVRRVRQRRAGLLRAVAHPRPALGVRPVHGAVRDGGQGRQGR